MDLQRLIDVLGIPKHSVKPATAEGQTITIEFKDGAANVSYKQPIAIRAGLPTQQMTADTRSHPVRAGSRF
jgi:hypothetical protein